MKTVFVDSNVLIRYFSGDDPQQSPKADKLLERAREKKVQLVTGPPVLFETAWVLRRSRKEPIEGVLDYFDALAAHSGLKMIDADLVKKATALAREHGIEFAEAYIAANAQQLGIHEIATFNRKDFSKAGMALTEF